MNQESNKKVRLIPFTLAGAMEGKKIVNQGFVGFEFIFGGVAPDGKEFNIWGKYPDGSWRSISLNINHLSIHGYELEDPLPEEPKGLNDEEINVESKRRDYDMEYQEVSFRHGAKWARDQIQNKK